LIGLAGRVQRDWKSQGTCAAPISLRHIDRESPARRAADAHRADIARADAEREPTVSRHPVAFHARNAGHVHRLIVRHPLRRAVGEPSTNARIAHRREFGVRVIRAPDIVRPIVHRRDTGAQRFGYAEHDAAVAVLRREELPQAVAHGEVTQRVDIGPDKGPKQTCPKVPVRVHEARHADHAAALHDLSIRQLDPWSDRDNRAVAHMHVTRFEIPEARVHGQDGSAADDEFAARRQRRAWRARRSRDRLLAEKLTRCRNQSAQCGRAFEHRAPAHAREHHGWISLSRILL